MAYPVLLLTKSDFNNYSDIANNYPLARLNHFILEAQDLDLKPFLGYAQFTDFFLKIDQNTDGTANTSSLSSQYLQLLNGGFEYINYRGDVFTYQGLKKMLVYYALARMIEFGNSQITATGIVKKVNPESQPLSSKDLTLMFNQFRSKGKAAEQEVKNFLINNKLAYPLYHINYESDRRRGSGPRIVGIDKSDFNSPLGFSSVIRDILTVELYGGQGSIQTSNGQTSTNNFVYHQAVPALSAIVTHNLNKYPTVIVLDGSNTLIAAGIQYVDPNTVHITLTGSAIIWTAIFS